MAILQVVSAVVQGLLRKRIPVTATEIAQIALRTTDIDMADGIMDMRISTAVNVAVTAVLRENATEIRHILQDKMMTIGRNELVEVKQCLIRKLF